MAKAKTESRKVVVPTEHRGVFFGTFGSRDGNEVTLAYARNCIYWPQQNRGFLGLAAQGPVDGARVGPAVPQLTLTKVTSISDCTPEAVSRWEAAPWS